MLLYLFSTLGPHKQHVFENMHLLLKNALSLRPMKKCSQFHHPRSKHKTERSPGKASYGRPGEASSHFIGWSKALSVSFNQLSIHFIIISFRPYFLSLLLKLMRANLVIKTLTGACLQLSMCSSVSGIPLFGDWVNLFSRNSYSLCSHLSHHFNTILIHFQV